MEVVREYIDADQLASVLTLPENFKNCMLEVIVLPVEEPEIINENDASKIDKAIHALSGAVPYTDISLEELREERLRKYENIN